MQTPLHAWVVVVLEHRAHTNTQPFFHAMSVQDDDAPFTATKPGGETHLHKIIGSFSLGRGYILYPGKDNSLSIISLLQIHKWGIGGVVATDFLHTP
jgi:hypothetical protein